MSLDTVVDDITEEAQSRAEEIKAEGERRAEEIREQAREEADEIRREAEREVESEIEQERKQTLSSAKLEAKQTRLEARREVLEDVYDRVREEIAGLEGDRREELTRALVEAGAEEFADDESVVVYGRPEDADLIDRILADYDGFERDGETDCLGGVVLQGERSRVRVNNTFDSLLESVWEDNLRAISDRLFEE